MNSAPLQSFHIVSWKAVFTGGVLLIKFSRPGLLIFVQPSEVGEMTD